jgi:hypothetical protein
MDRMCAGPKGTNFTAGTTPDGGTHLEALGQEAACGGQVKGGMARSERRTAAVVRSISGRVHMASRSWIRFGVAAAAAALFMTARAQEACKADAAKLCPGVPAGKGRIAACLTSHQAELSPGCADYLAAVKAEAKEVADACQADAEVLCYGTPTGKGRIASCLKSHQAQLSPPCRSAIAAAKAK